MNRTTAIILLVCASGLSLAFDPLGVRLEDRWETDDEWLAGTLVYDDAGSRRHCLGSLAAKLGNERVGEKIVEFIEPVFDDACALSYPEKKYVLCRRGLHALGYLRATNSLPFLEKAVLHGREDLRNTALNACQKIMGYDDAYLNLLDRALGEGAITRGDYTVEIGVHYWGVHNGDGPVTPEHCLKTAIRLMKNPSIGFYAGPKTDGLLLADFPSYTNSVERLMALTVLIDNSFTPPDVRAKYESERDRLKALPPEELVCATDELEAQLDALLKAAERKRKIAQVKKYAVPAGIAVLVAVVVCAVAWRRRK